MTEERLKILIADDEAAARFAMRRVLEKADYDVAESEDGNATIEKCRSEAPDILFLDLNMPGADGMKVLEKLSGMDVAPLVIVVTAHGSEKIAVEAMKSGAYDYVAKPYNIDELRHAAHRAAETIRLRRETQKLRSDFDLLKGYGRLVGQSASMQDVFRRIERVADTDATVLITGQSGTGKELVAREIHRRSARRDRPLVIVNCAAMPETLVESELFGYEKGAFTGAVSRRVGKIQQAHRGTLFLDEIGDMPLSLQAKILRLLQEKSIERLGGRETIPVDVRIIAATNRDLETALAEGRFREDLYYRLKVVTLWLPPLRHRMDDIVHLVDYFFPRFCKELATDNPGLSQEAKAFLSMHSWPGNVRELANALQKALIFSRGGPISLEGISQAVGDKRVSVDPDKTAEETIRQWVRETLATDTAKDKFNTLVDRFARILLGEALDLTSGNRTRACELLGMSRPTLLSKIEKYGLRTEISVKGD